MLTKHHLIKNKVWYSILGIAFLILLAGVVLIFTKSYPVAMVSNSFISSREFENYLTIAKKFESNSDRSMIFNQLIVNEKKKQMSGKINVDDELKYYKTGRLDEYTKFLRDYFSGSEKSFVKYIVTPSAADAMLRIKYNSDFGRNNIAYDKTTRVIDELNNGRTFEDLAKTDSDDKLTGQLGGDLGFVGEGQLLPELEHAVKSATLGEVKKQVVVSRLGYHILYPVDTATKDGHKVWHVKHILITTTGYDNWLEKGLTEVPVRRFTNL